MKYFHNTSQNASTNLCDHQQGFPSLHLFSNTCFHPPFQWCNSLEIGWLPRWGREVFKTPGLKPVSNLKITAPPWLLASRTVYTLTLPFPALWHLWPSPSFSVCSAYLALSIQSHPSASVRTQNQLDCLLLLWLGMCPPYQSSSQPLLSWLQHSWASSVPVLQGQIYCYLSFPSLLNLSYLFTTFPSTHTHQPA